MDDYRNRKCSSDDEFRARARLHQSKFREEELKANYQDYGSRLAWDAASQGLNFYEGFPEIFEKVRSQFPIKTRPTPIYHNMLRSEHIPYNMFVPLKSELGMALASSVFNRFLRDTISEITKIEIEYAPQHREEYLDDKTAFDTYIEYKHVDGSNGFLGIEIKYTEQAYSYTKKEKAEIENPESLYNSLTREINIYNDVDKLKSRSFKQLWRNQLLGEKILVKDGNKFKHATSLVMFPRGNQYFIKKTKEYASFLKDEYKDKFIPITYEDFIKTVKEYAIGDYRKWIEYLERRYIVK